MRTPARLVRLLVPLLFVVVLAIPAGADPSWKETKGYELIQKQEVKVLNGLLKTAMKEEYRRQAWYLADRILAIDSGHKLAIEAVETWDQRQLLEGEDPDKGFVKKRDGKLRNLGDDIFHFGETLEAAGVDPVDYYEINQRAQAYGSRAGPLMSALKSAGYVWMETFLDREAKNVQALLGVQLMQEIEYPTEFDDAYLKYRANWPGVVAARWGNWRIVSDHAWEEALRHVAVVADIESFAIETMGKGKPMRGKPHETITDLAIFASVDSYDKIGPDYIRERDADRFAKQSSWYSRWRRRAMVTSEHRDNPWVAPHALTAGMVGRVLARTRYSGGATGRVSGRGYWLLDGMQGAFEGLHRIDDRSFELDPKGCWQLAAARALRDTGQLLPWEEFYKLDWNGMRDGPTVDSIEIHVNGTAREAKNVNIASAQATALVVGVFLSDKKKGPKNVAKLLADYFKRDVLGDCEKTLKWKKGRIVDEANKAMDAIPVP